jgi:hypothetical protein
MPKIYALVETLVRLLWAASARITFILLLSTRITEGAKDEVLEA